MMTGPHPHDLELLDYVEDELPNDRRREVGAHVESCATCEATVGELEAARAALRAVPTLELPADGQERIRAALADSDSRRRGRTRSPLRLAAVLAPVAVLAALVAGVVTMADFGGDDPGHGGEAAMLEAEEDADSRAAEGAEAEDPDGGAGEAAPAPEEGAETSGATPTFDPLSAAGPVASVRGPAEEVAAILRDRGFDARADERKVVVRNARPRAVVRALADQPSGAVAVEVE